LFCDGLMGRLTLVNGESVGPPGSLFNA
jgi:hypothetical protein